MIWKKCKQKGLKVLFIPLTKEIVIDFFCEYIDLVNSFSILVYSQNKRTYKEIYKYMLNECVCFKCEIVNKYGSSFGLNANLANYINKKIGKATNNISGGFQE